MLLLLALLAVLGWTKPGRAESVTVNGVVAVVDADAGPSAASKTDNSNAVVWLTPVGASAKLDGRPPQSSRPKVRMSQHHKKFEPRLLVIPVGSVVDFPNLDPFFHNVFSLFEGKRFDLGLYEAGTTHSVHFDRPGISYVFCNIHPEMSAVVIVLDTPYYATSNRAGEITIADVPSGRYIMSVWRERTEPHALKTHSREVTISPGNTSLGTIRLVDAGDLLARHKNKYGYDYPNQSRPRFRTNNHQRLVQRLLVRRLLKNSPMMSC